MPRKIQGKPLPVIAPQSAIDCITDPFALATHLLSVSTYQDQNTYGPYMRVSALAEGCVRERVLGYLHKLKPKKERWSPQMNATFDLGKSFHWWLQNDPYNNYFGNRRVGFWKCLACGRKRFGGPPKKPCAQCGASHKALMYDEVTLKMRDPFMASGHVDMYLRMTARGKLVRIADFKSVSKKEFDKLEQVRGKDAIQVTGYMMMSEYDQVMPDLVRVDTQRAFIVYVAKEHVAKGLPFKVFHVVRNKVWDRTVVELFNRFTTGVTGGALPPPLPECAESNWDAARAKYCPAGGRCRIV